MMENKKVQDFLDEWRKEALNHKVYEGTDELVQCATKFFTKRFYDEGRSVKMLDIVQEFLETEYVTLTADEIEELKDLNHDCVTLDSLTLSVDRYNHLYQDSAAIIYEDQYFSDMMKYVNDEMIEVEHAILDYLFFSVDVSELHKIFFEE